MGAIYRREVKAYFTSPLAYVFLFISMVVSGFLFVVFSLFLQTSDLTGYFGNWYLVFLIFVPLLTMRLMAEERKLKTDQVLLTSPVSITSIVLGKFFAAMTVMLIAIGLSLIFVVIVAIFGTPMYGELITHYIGLLLITGVMVAIGIFISSITESQVLSAVITMGIFFALWIIGWLASFLNNSLAIAVVQYLSIPDLIGQFTGGLLNVAPVIYMLSVIVLFLYLTIRSVEKRRWS